MQDKSHIEYIPPATHQIETYGREVCHELGEDFTEPEVIAGFTQFMKVVIAFAARRLNQRRFDNVDE